MAYIKEIKTYLKIMDIKVKYITFLKIKILQNVK